MDRYYCDMIDASNDISLPDDQVHHALHVKRLRDGEEIEIFDGCGRAATARVKIGKHCVRCEKIGEVRLSAPPLFSLHIATAIPKADRSDQLLESASQLGVHTVTWIDCRHSVVKVDGSGAKAAKWRRIAIESAKQCRRNWLMNVEGPIPMDRHLAGCSDPVLFADPSQGPHLNDWMIGHTPSAEVTIFIGPEGGLSPDEIQALLAHGAQGVSLGVHILRIETAVAAAAAIMGRWLIPPLS
ncbi:MAG: RsmE family RNA methyltransferase [Phycisphaerae bacterium]